MLLPLINYSEILSVKEVLLKGWQRKRLEYKRQETHVSDLIYCRRKVAFERLDPNIPVVDEKN
jgi:hypothetical protein